MLDTDHGQGKDRTAALDKGLRGEHSATLRHGARRLGAPGTLKPLAHTCPRNHLGSLCAGAVGLWGWPSVLWKGPRVPGYQMPGLHSRCVQLRGLGRFRTLQEPPSRVPVLLTV